MPVFEIWSEGYAATGEHSPASKFGEAEGDTFEQACQLFFLNREDKQYYNPERNTYWMCRLFDNEAEARKSFG